MREVALKPSVMSTVESEIGLVFRELSSVSYTHLTLPTIYSV